MNYLSHNSTKSKSSRAEYDSTNDGVMLIAGNSGDGCQRLAGVANNKQV